MARGFPERSDPEKGEQLNRRAAPSSLVENQLFVMKLVF